MSVTGWVLVHGMSTLSSAMRSGEATQVRAKAAINDDLVRDFLQH